ncbi:MAG TPA: RDD family protein [Solirubrobacterales bacterium]|nr:RDD family protein [Solirubrobacterales bacterium]
MAARPPASESGGPDERPDTSPRPEVPANGGLGSLFESTARAGLSGARGVARRLRIDRVVDRGVDRALDSETAARATERFLDNETTKRVWEKVLESDEAQKLVERVAEAPEVRAAITRQGVGLLEDLRRGARSAARRADTAVERVARGILRRPRRQGRPIFAGAFSRLLALAIDAGVVYGSLLLITAAIAALVNAFSSGDQNADTVVFALGFFAWSLIAFAYLVIFWSGAGRTPGMSFVAIRMLSEDATPVRPGQAIRRVIWLGISALPLLLGFWGILFEAERRGWPDRRAHTVVCYADPDLDKDLV